MLSKVIISASLLCLSQARTGGFDRDAFYDSQQPSPAPTIGKLNITYDSKLRCGSCLMAGFLYCYKGTEAGATFEQELGSTNSVCCKSTADCPQLSQDGWICPSVEVVDADYKLSTCPFVTSRCGAKEH